MRPKILIGQIFHEGNSLNSRPTSEVDFRILRGNAMIADAAGTGTVLGGILDVLIGEDVQIIPTLAASASPGGPVTRDLWDVMRSEIAGAARQTAPDAVILDLHGAMVVTGEDDPEGALLTALREVLGPDVPIGVGLDLHGHVTDTMCGAVDVLVACKNNPHDDYNAAGRRAARLTLDALAGRISPVLSRVRIPMILFGNDETTHGPLEALNRSARALEAGGALDISIFNVQAMLDVPGMGQVITAMTDGDPARGARACETLAHDLAATAEAFTTDHLPLAALWDMLPRAAGALPYAVSDFGDRVLAGAAGDSPEILRAALRRRGIAGAIPITDPEAAIALQDRAPGRTVDIQLGGAHSGAAPVRVKATLILHHCGRFRLDGPWLGGADADHGKTALLQAEGIHIIVTERPAYSQDTAFFSALGIDITGLDFVVCKSGFHFKLSFAGKATPITVGTDGPGRYDPARRGLRRAPIWPEIGPKPAPSGVRHFTRRFGGKPRA